MDFNIFDVFVPDTITSPTFLLMLTLFCGPWGFPWLGPFDSLQSLWQLPCYLVQDSPGWSGTIPARGHESAVSSTALGLFSGKRHFRTMARARGAKNFEGLKCLFFILWIWIRSVFSSLPSPSGSVPTAYACTGLQHFVDNPIIFQIGKAPWSLFIFFF